METSWYSFRHILENLECSVVEFNPTVASQTTSCHSECPLTSTQLASCHLFPGGQTFAETISIYLSSPGPLINRSVQAWLLGQLASKHQVNTSGYSVLANNNLKLQSHTSMSQPMICSAINELGGPLLGLHRLRCIWIATEEIVTDRLAVGPFVQTLLTTRNTNTIDKALFSNSYI
ncbi:unnamed protein product, partial [Protopolystoma xenopodis]